MLSCTDDTNVIYARTKELLYNDIERLISGAERFCTLILGHVVVTYKVK